MPYVKTAFGITRRFALPSTRGEYANPEEQKEFNELLKKVEPSWEVLTRSSALSKSSTRHKDTLTQNLGYYPKHVRSLSRLSIETLDLKLINGPLAGMEIRACVQGDVLSLNISVVDRYAFDSFIGSQESLEKELSALFNRTVSLEIRSAATKTQ